MLLIPVLDLRHGAVVHARGGQRAQYRPLRTRLCAGNDALDVVAALLAVHPFRCCYVADLDAIVGEDSQVALLERLRARYPDLALWVDGGFRDLDAVQAWHARGLGTPVLGSESLSEPLTATQMARLTGAPETILSLDFRDGRALDAAGLWHHPQNWPSRVIVMSLSHVGADRGPDLELWRCIQSRAGSRKLYGAGGVRDRCDVQVLRERGAAGVLLASALHAGRIGARDCVELEA